MYFINQRADLETSPSPLFFNGSIFPKMYMHQNTEVVPYIKPFCFLKKNKNTIYNRSWQAAKVVQWSPYRAFIWNSDPSRLPLPIWRPVLASHPPLPLTAWLWGLSRWVVAVSSGSLDSAQSQHFVVPHRGRRAPDRPRAEEGKAAWKTKTARPCENAHSERRNMLSRLVFVSGTKYRRESFIVWAWNQAEG